MIESAHVFRVPDKSGPFILSLWWLLLCEPNMCGSEGKGAYLELGLPLQCRSQGCSQQQQQQQIR